LIKPHTIATRNSRRTRAADAEVLAREFYPTLRGQIC
jgi:hypothetical protein